MPWRRKFRGSLQQHTPLLLTCREFENFVCEYLDGTLSWRRRLVFRLHLLYCRECRDYLASYTRAIAVGRAVFRHPDERVPETIPEELVTAILAARDNP